MAAKTSADRDSSAENSSSFQMAAVWASEKVREWRVCHNGKLYFDHLGHSIGKFPERQSFEKGSVDEDVLGLPERANKVFAVRGIDCRLSSNA